MPILEIAQQHGTYKAMFPGEYAGPCPNCGGAVRFRIWPDKKRFACTSCGIEGGIEDAQKLWVNEPGISDKSDSVPMRLIEGREVWFPSNPGEWRRLVIEGKIVFGPKEAKIMMGAPCLPPSTELLLNIKEVFVGAFISGIEKL